MTAKNEIKALLNVLEADEWPWLRKLLASPYHNTDERLLTLLELLRAAPDYDVDATTAFAQLFPGEPYVARKWGDLLRKFLAVLREFLRQQQLRRDAVTHTRLSTDALLARRLYPLLPPALDDYARAIAASDLSPWERADDQRRYWQKRYELPTTAPLMEDALAATEYNRLLYCLLELRYRIEWQVVHKGRTPEDPAQVSTLLTLSERLEARHPLLQLYREVFLALSDSPPYADAVARCAATYYRLMPELYHYDRTFFFTKLSVLYNDLVQAQQAGARAALFELFRFAVRHHIFRQSEKMTERTFLNICTIGVAEEDPDWVEAFRAAYLPHLAEADTTNAALLSSAMLAYSKGDYGAVYRIGGQASRLPLNHRLVFYLLQLKAHTELYLQNDTNAETFRNFLHSTDRFLRYQQAIRARTKDGFMALIKLMRRLIYLRERMYPTAQIKTRLETKLNATPNIVAGEWVRAKIAQL